MEWVIRGHTVTMSEKVALQFRLLRKRFIGSMTSLPAAIVTVTFSAVHRAHMLRNQMFLQRTSIREAGTTRDLHPIVIEGPFANMGFVVISRKSRACQP